MILFWIPSTLERRVALRCRPGQSQSGFKECQQQKKNGLRRRRQWCKCGKFTSAHCGGKRAIKKCQLDTCNFLFKWTRCQPDGAYFMASNRNEYGWCSLSLPLYLSFLPSLSLTSNDMRQFCFALLDTWLGYYVIISVVYFTRGKYITKHILFQRQFVLCSTSEDYQLIILKIYCVFSGKFKQNKFRFAVEIKLA